LGSVFGSCVVDGRDSVRGAASGFDSCAAVDFDSVRGFVSVFDSRDVVARDSVRGVASVLVSVRDLPSVRELFKRSDADALAGTT
jgi:hypothetical protein